MNDHIIEFKNLYKKISGFEMKCPDPVLVFKLLDGVSDDEHKLALALGKI